MLPDAHHGSYTEIEPKQSQHCGQNFKMLFMRKPSLTSMKHRIRGNYNFFTLCDIALHQKKRKIFFIGIKMEKYSYICTYKIIITHYSGQVISELNTLTSGQYCLRKH